MADNWDEGSDDEWAVSDDDLDKRLNQLNGPPAATAANTTPQFDEEEDLAVKERALAEKAKTQELRVRGNALAEKKAAEQARIEEEEIARKAVEIEAAAEANMSPEERRLYQQRLIEAADNALTDDLFGNTGNTTNAGKAATVSATSDVLVLNDIKDHLKHARKTATAMREHGKIHLVSAFFKECIAQSAAVLDDDAVSELIKQLNVLKNEKTQAAKRKVKGQANKAKKADKESIEKARKMVETFGDNDKFDQYDTIGEDFEDDFF
jgi:translation initiation factor 3 subunit J